MCQTIVVYYSCGCIKDQLSLPCEEPKPICSHLSQFFDKQTLSELCPEHNVHPAFRSTLYTSKQDWTTAPGPALEKFSARMAEGSHRKIRHQPAFERLPATITRTRPTRPEQVRVPSSKGLDGLPDKIGAISSGSTNGLTRYRRPSASRTITPASRSGRSTPQEIPNRFASPPVTAIAPSPGIPRRRPLPADVMAIPVYDNGSSASSQQAKRLRALSQTDPALLGRRPATSASNTEASLYPAPLDTIKIRRGLSAASSKSTRDRPTRDRNHPPNAFLNRPLPEAPTHELSRFPSQSSTASTRSGTSKPSTSTSRPSTATSSKSSLSTTPAPRLRHDDSVRAFQDRQASQTRILNAQRAVDSGRWTRRQSCPEIECLSQDERHKVNVYIQRKRDEEREREHKHETRRKRRPVSEIIPAAGGHGMRRRESKKRGCVVM